MTCAQWHELKNKEDILKEEGKRDRNEEGDREMKENKERWTRESYKKERMISLR
jgi:hypothetical protein